MGIDKPDTASARACYEITLWNFALVVGWEQLKLAARAFVRTGVAGDWLGLFHSTLLSGGEVHLPSNASGFGQ